MSVRTEQTRARERARHMVDMLARDEMRELAESAARLISDGAAERELLYPLLVELTDACAQMINARAGEVTADTAFTLDIADLDEGPVDIDEIPPAIRALLRGLLAFLEQHRDDALFQLNMAAQDPQVRGRLDALVHGLLCARSLLDERDGTSHAPAWLV